jgi:L-2-hydroxyglutarate oxidase LhgO
VPKSVAVQDFVIQGPPQHGVDGLINLFGIESPGLTSCLALANLVDELARSS